MSTCASICVIYLLLNVLEQHEAWGSGYYHFHCNLDLCVTRPSPQAEGLNMSPYSHGAYTMSFPQPSPEHLTITFESQSTSQLFEKDLLHPHLSIISSIEVKHDHAEYHQASQELIEGRWWFDSRKCLHFWFVRWFFPCSFYERFCLLDRYFRLILFIKT